PRHPTLCSARFPYTTLFRSLAVRGRTKIITVLGVPSAIFQSVSANRDGQGLQRFGFRLHAAFGSHHAQHVIFQRQFLSDVLSNRSEEHTSELQSHLNLVRRP